MTVQMILLSGCHLSVGSNRVCIFVTVDVSVLVLRCVRAHNGCVIKQENKE